MERNDGLRRILLRPSVYQFAQRAIGAHKSSTKLAEQVIRSGPSTTIVDIGCGTADIVDYITFASYVGFDPNPPYVEQANARMAPRAATATVLHGKVGEPELERRLPQSCNIAMMMGVLHHLDDSLAGEALALAARLVGRSGRFISFDPVLEAGQSRIAAALIKRDRGQHVRTVDQTRALLAPHFASISLSVRTDFLAVPYTHLVVEAANLP